METKHKTLAECKDEVARLRAYKDWQDMYLRELQINSAAWTFLLKCTEEAAELYAGQTKQSSPASADVEQEFEDFWNFAYSEHGLTTSDPEFDTIDYEACGKIFKAGFLANKSQQPTSVAWLSDEEIKEIFPISGEKQDSFWQTSRREGARHLQSELRKRVIDPVVFHEWMSEKYVRVYRGQRSGKYFDRYSPFEEIYYTGNELLQIYLTHKAKDNE